MSEKVWEPFARRSDNGEFSSQFFLLLQMNIVESLLSRDKNAEKKTLFTEAVLPTEAVQVVAI